MQKKQKQLWLNLILIIVIPLTTLPALGNNTNTIGRPYETIMIKGAEFPSLLNASISQLSFYQYDVSLDQWEPIPVQIDEMDTDSSYFGTKNGVLDEYDEVLFMASDLGDQANTDQWVSDSNARNIKRIEIECLDPLTANLGWIYIYISSTLTGSDTTYLDYNVAEDRIQSIYYNLKNGTSGFPDELRIPVSAGGDDIEFLDRLKMMFRVKVTAFGNTDYITIREKIDTSVKLFGFINVDIKVWKIGTTYSQTPVMRLNRNLSLGMQAKASAFGLDYLDTLTFTTQYYPAYSKLSTGELSIPKINESGVTGAVDYIILSQDLNFFGTGMKFYNPLNQQGDIRVDAQPDPTMNQTLTWPGSNWALIVADPTYTPHFLTSTSILYILKVAGPPPGSQRKLYYSDESFSAPNITGDLTTIGDTGIEITGAIQSENISLENASYYLPENLSYSEAANLVDEHLNPVNVRIQSQRFTYPVIVTIDPPGTGTVQLNPPVEMAFQDTVMTATATGNALYYFDHWSGNVPDTSAIIQFTVDQAYNLTAHFLPYRQITIGTNPPDRKIYIDDIQYNTTQIFNAKPGEIFKVRVDTILNEDPSGSRERFTDWNKGQTVPGIDYVVPDMNDVLLANFQAEYYLSLSVTPVSSGTTNPPPPGLWLKENSLLKVEAVRTTSDMFMQWQGDFSGTDNPLTINMDDSYSAVAKFGNYPPVVTTPDTFFTEEETLFLPLTTINKWVSDQNHHDSLLTIQLNEGNHINVSWLDTSQTYALSTPANWFGNDSLLLTAIDEKGSIGQNFLRIQVFNKPDKPSTFALSEPQSGTLYTEWPTSVPFSWEASMDNDPLDILTYTFFIDTTLTFNSDLLQTQDDLPSIEFDFSWPDSFINGRYFWYVMVEDTSGLSALSTDTFSIELATSIDKPQIVNIPEIFQLSQNYPNPFNHRTTIPYALPKPSNVEIKIYNQKGQLIQRIKKGLQEPGYYTFIWDNRNSRGHEVTSGIYFITLIAEKERAVIKALYLK